MAEPIKETPLRLKFKKAKDRATKNLIDKGWKYDGLWYYSPYTNLRYHKQEALSIEELRDWSSGPSAFLNDYEHAIWVAQEEEDNQLIDMDELSKRSKARQEINELASRSNINSKRKSRAG